MNAMKKVAALAVALTAMGAGTAWAGSSGGKKTVLVLNVGPDPTDVYIDDKKKGTSDKVKEVVVEPGAHIVRLVHNGDEHEDQVILKKGQTVKFEWKFEDDRPKPAGSDDDDSTGGKDPAPAAAPTTAKPADAPKDAPPSAESPKDTPPSDDMK